MANETPPGLSPATIIQLVIQLGPVAFSFIQDMLAVWNKPELTPEEAIALCRKYQKSYDEFMAE